MTIYGLFARTKQRRDQLEKRFAALLPPGFPNASHPGWWKGAGVALHGNTISRSGPAQSTSALTSTCVGSNTSGLSMNGLVDSPMISLNRARGPFALAFWNADTQELILARDHLGQQRMFVRDEESIIFFTSQFSALLKGGFFRQGLDYESAVHYLAYGTPVIGHTLSRGVSSLPAAHMLTASADKPSFQQRYYTPLTFHAAKVPDERQIEYIQATLDASIMSHTSTERQALLLSAGIDSSYIASTFAKNGLADNLDAYTVRFDTANVESENEIANRTATSFGINHSTIDLSSIDAQVALDAVLSTAEPCSSWTAITHLHLTKSISAFGHNQLLSGLGADETFGGYSVYLDFYKRFRRFSARHATAMVVDPLDSMLWCHSTARPLLFAGIPNFLDTRERSNALKSPFSKWDSADLLAAFYRECRTYKKTSHAFELMVAHECQHRIPDLLLSQFDQSSALAGISMRYPFLEPTLVNSACALGASERFWVENGRWRNKKLLRHLASTRLPQEVLTRLPTSYTAPFGAWLYIGAFFERVLAVIESSKLTDMGLIEQKWLEALKRELISLHNPSYKPPKKTALDHIWIVVTLSEWLNRWGGASPLGS